MFEIDPLRWIDRLAPKPLLLLYGDRDPFVPPSEIDQLIARAGNPKEVWRVPAAAHRNLQELQPAEYRHKIIRFFDENL